MRIVLLNQYYAPDEAATAQVLADLGSALATAGHEVTAICSDRSYSDAACRFSPSEVIGGVRVARAKSTGFGRRSALGRLTDYATFLLGAARRLLFGLRPDVVISLTTPPMISLLGTLCARLRGSRSILWSMDVYPELAFELGAIRRHSIAGTLLTFLSLLAVRTPDVIVALGETMARRLRNSGAKRVEVIHNWAAAEVADVGLRVSSSEHSRWDAEERPDTISNSEVGIRESVLDRACWKDDFIIMYSGNMGLAHEFDTVLEAAAKIANTELRGLNAGRGSSEIAPSDTRRGSPAPFANHDSQFGIRFAFVGGGPRLDEVKRSTDELGLRNVDFRPYVSREELGKSLAAATLHLVTMRDGMQGLLVPSKIYGILAAGKPALYVGPSEGEIFDILSSGKCGTCVGVGDVDGVVRAISSYASDPERVSEEGRRARALSEKYARAKSLTKFIKMIEKIG